MAWPAILRETVSVGAMKRGPDGWVLSNHTQPLHVSLGTGCHTTVFAEPGPPGGTSGAAAIVAGRLADLRATYSSAGVQELLARMLQDSCEARDESD
jgi:hypothetical protein